MLADVDGVINTNDNDNADLAVKQKYPWKTIINHKPTSSFFGLNGAGLISEKKKNVKVLYKRNFCQWFLSWKLFWDCFQVREN